MFWIGMIIRIAALTMLALFDAYLLQALFLKESGEYKNIRDKKRR